MSSLSDQLPYNDNPYRKAKDLGWEKINPSSPLEINKERKHACFDVVEIGSTLTSPFPLVNVLCWNLLTIYGG
jgi:hypothetical protein